MTELKTRRNRKSVERFLSALTNRKRQEDALQMVSLMTKLTGETPRMWGPGIVGFGTCQYRYKSGRQGEWFLSGFSPRKDGLTVYIICGLSHCQELLDQLGKHRTGKSCLYIRRLEDIDRRVLEELLNSAVARARRLDTTHAREPHSGS